MLATRSPHRPTPVGLSVGRVRSVNGNVLELLGLDLVDGSPILDIKPFLPFCDAPRDATAPEWAQASRVRVWGCEAACADAHDARRRRRWRSRC